ncbi:VCBS repeat-containing protein [Poritiphilus flavus]|uniref:RNA-binding protein n=1 Tax=Poritiphilus flavus TaxID=2697053 RepID=A0A6L9E7R3_9FLAO|nr:VCBS repeat-containing protein [Poritiphilus flavus]NAS10740.1 RNA-binding protein [Poritiphilus flavus]
MRSLLLISILGSLIACSEPAKPVFELVAAKQSGIFFNNEVIGNDSLNIMDYDYFYNGGGIGVGDFNLDGKPDLYFSANLKSSRMYINQGDLRFLDATESANVSTSAWCTGVSVIDINQDGKPDIHVATGSNDGKSLSPNYFFINRTVPGRKVVFEEMAQQMGLKDSLYAIQAAWLDYDKDGDLDMFIAHNAIESVQKNVPHGQRTDGSGKSTDKLYRNEGLKDGIPIFKDVSKEAGILIEGWSLGVQISDFNGDGYPDIYVANDFLSNDILYLNNQDGTFTNDIENRLRHQSHNSMGMDISDIDNDLDLDIMVLDMLPEDNLRKKTMFPDVASENYRNILNKGYQEQYVRNVMQLNKGDGTYGDIGNLTNVSATDWSWAPLIADYDNDGLRDIYITNGYVKEITDLDFVDYYNKSNIFGTKDSKRKKLIQQLNSMKGVKKPNVLFENKEAYNFKNATSSFGLDYPSFSNGAAYADLDKDGDLDLVVNNINDAAFLFRNNTIQESNTTSPGANYLGINLTPDNRSLGSRVVVYTQNREILTEHYPQRGYLSSVGPTLHFGLFSDQQIDSLIVHWPDSSISRITNPEINQVINIDWNTAAKTTYKNESERNQPTFQRIHPRLAHMHQETTFNEFTNWPLHFRSYDKLGPIMVLADVNSDQKSDLFIGGSANFNSEIWTQSEIRGFNEKIIFNGSIDKSVETIGATFFDADGDGDLDLYCANGSSEHYQNKTLLQDHLYLNDGKGNFWIDLEAIPEISEITITPITLDYDRDGDMDLFVGGRVDPENYPHSPRSYLLENDGKGRFTDVTRKIAPDLMRPGMITSAALSDFDKDGWNDLILAGEWMPLTLFRNRDGKFLIDVNKNGLSEHRGWWNYIKTADIDQDGDLDIVAGNWGLNNPFKASIEEPLRIYGKDFDGNGSIESIMTYYNFGQEYIFHPRNTLTKRIPELRKRLFDYKTYGNTPFPEVFTSQELNGAISLELTTLASGIFENMGNGNFKFHPFPKLAQVTPLFDFSIVDLNNDGLLDILGVGNFFGTEVLTGRYDAGDGIVLMGIGGFNFEVHPVHQTGFKVPEEARSIKTVTGMSDHGNQDWFIVATRNDSLKVFSRALIQSKKNYANKN